MNTKTIGLIMAAAILLAGCGKDTGSATSPVVTKFLATDWSARPLFPAGSVLNLSESQFSALPVAEEQTKSQEMVTQLASLKQSAAAVAQAGEDAAAKGDLAQARKCFQSLKQCGAALDSPDCMDLVRLVGKAFEKQADAELAKLGP